MPRGPDRGMLPKLAVDWHTLPLNILILFHFPSYPTRTILILSVPSHDLAQSSFETKQLNTRIPMKCHRQNEPSRLEIDTCCTHFTLHLNWPTQLNKSNSTALFVVQRVLLFAKTWTCNSEAFWIPPRKDGKENKKENEWRWKELQFRLVSQGKRSWSLRVF